MNRYLSESSSDTEDEVIDANESEWERNSEVGNFGLYVDVCDNVVFGESCFVNNGCDEFGIVNNELNDELNTELNNVNIESQQIVNNESFGTLDISLTAPEDNNDEEFVPSTGEDSEDAEISQDDQPLQKDDKLRNERTLFVYESNLYELLAHCPKCGSVVDRSMIKEVQNTGRLLHLKITCFNSCNVEWKSQPSVGGLKGLGNIYLSTSIAFSSIPFAKFERFA